MAEGVVAIVGGTGKLGSVLARRLLAAGREVVIGSRDGERAAALAATLGDGNGRVRGASNAAAAAAAGVVVVTIPYDGQRETIAPLRAATAGRVVVSTAVPVRFAERGPRHVAVPEGSAAQQLAALLPEARVVAALHTVSSATLGRLERPLDADVLLTGDEAAAKAVVADVLRGIRGARPVDAGPLVNAQHVEQLAVLLLSINVRARRNTGVRITNLPEDRAMEQPE